jgi:radical SAM enzyme (TIGR01210 family)
VAAYPATASARDAFVLASRPPRARHDPWRAHGIVFDCEPDAEGVLANVVTVFLTGRECPWRCAMCDLWQFTTEEDTPPGAIPHQIRAALSQAPRVPGSDSQRHIKLYNAGSFFDPRAIPPDDYPAIAAAIAGFSRVIVESHPSLIGPRVDRWIEALDATGVTRPTVEVAMGLETAHPEALARLNKRMTVDDFRAAAAALRERGIEVRAFLLVSPPFVPAGEQPEWLRRSVDTAFDAGASAVSLIPMRSGNGAVDALEAEGEFTPPTLGAFEDAFAGALTRRPADRRVFADVWDLGRLARCAACVDVRTRRLIAMNELQRVLPPVGCDECVRVESRP